MEVVVVVGNSGIIYSSTLWKSGIEGGLHTFKHTVFFRAAAVCVIYTVEMNILLLSLDPLESGVFYSFISPTFFPVGSGDLSW